MEDNAGRPKIPADLWTQAQDLAEKSDPPSTPGAIVRTALRKYLRAHEGDGPKDRLQITEDLVRAGEHDDKVLDRAEVLFKRALPPDEAERLIDRLREGVDA